MFKKFYILNATKDNSIHSFYVDANCGKSQNLKLVKNSDNTYSRILLDFNMTDLINYFGAQYLLDSTFKANLVLTELRDADFDYNIEYNIECYSINSYWIEGSSAFDDYSVTGFSNWNYKAKNNAWSASGGDFNPSLSANCFLVNGSDDIVVDVTNIVRDYCSSVTAGTTSTFNGILIKYADEQDASFVETKSVYSTQTHTILNPKIFVSVNEPSVRDSRNSFIVNTPQDIFLNYSINGELSHNWLTNVYIQKNGVSITGTNLVYEKLYDGYYKANFTLPADSYDSTAVYNDVWIFNDNVSVTGALHPVSYKEYTTFNQQSLTGNFDKQFFTNTYGSNIGVSGLYNKEMPYNSTQMLRFMPYLKYNKGVDNLGLLFNNELIYPERFYVKFMDYTTVGYDWTDWIELDLIGDSFLTFIQTKSFKVNCKIMPIFKIIYNDVDIIIRSSDIIEIGREY